MREPAARRRRRPGASQRLPSAARRGSGAPRRRRALQCTASVSSRAIVIARRRRYIDRRLTRSSAAAASQSSSRSSPSAQTMKSNRHLPCALSKPGPHRQRPGDVARHQPLEEVAHIVARQADRRRGRGGWWGVGACPLAKEPRVTMQYNHHPPPRRLARPPARRRRCCDAVAPFTARQFARAIIMPNLSPPVTRVEQAAAYRDRILAAAGPGFTPLMTAYLTDDSDPDEIERGHARRRVGRGQALSRRRDDQFGVGRDRHRHISRACWSGWSGSACRCSSMAR